MSNHTDEVAPKKSSVQRTLTTVLVLAIVFGLGIFVGDNRVRFGLDGAFRTPLSQNANATLDYSEVDEVYESLRQGFDGTLDTEKLEDGLKSGLVSAAGDEYTEYLNVEATAEFNEQLSGSFEGIGAELGKEAEAVIIISPIEGFPAEKAGLRPRDIISKIDNESAYNISITDAVKKIRGQKGTSVTLEIIRDGKPQEYTIVRDTINLPSVKTEITEDNIGVIELTRFGDDTVQLVREAATDMRARGVRGVVLDMRSNPGGLLDAAVGVSSVWLEKGKPVLEEKRGDVVVKNFSASGNPIFNGVPTVVLINEGSASASEIVAGALRDNNVAQIVGQKSYGKGSVQEVRSLSSGGALKVTIARWFTPAGKNIDKEGIEPDRKVEISEEDFAAERDPQRDTALQLLR